MFNRREFLAGLVAGPAAALVHPKTRVVSDRQIWVIMGVNWLHNDEYAYCEGQVLTEYAFDNPEAANQRCAELIEDFCSKDDPDDFLPSDICTPEGWDDWEREQNGTGSSAVRPIRRRCTGARTTASDGSLCRSRSAK